MYLIDTNIFLEVMLSRGRSEECKRLLGALRSGKLRGAVTDFTIHSIMVLLGDLGRLDALKLFLRSLPAYRGLQIYTTSLASEARAVEIARKTGLDIDDAVQYEAALSLGARAIVSFDKHFDNLEIPRVEPRELPG